MSVNFVQMAQCQGAHTPVYSQFAHLLSDLGGIRLGRCTTAVGYL